MIFKTLPKFEVLKFRHFARAIDTANDVIVISGLFAIQYFNFFKLITALIAIKIIEKSHFSTVI